MDVVSDEELNKILKLAPEFESYIADIRKEIFLRLSTGSDVKGFKLVEGRSIRKWKASEETIIETLSKFMDFDEMYQSKLISPAQAEKINRELKSSEEFSKLVEKPKGKPVLALESDKRPAYNAESVFAEFKEE